MKKLRNKLGKQAQPASSRITKDTLSEHRKRVLDRGKRFKYPLQYSRNKLVINTIIIGAVALVLATIFSWWQLYPQQNTSAFAYRATSLVPLPVAKIEDASVRYSDYLLKYRSSRHYLEQKEHASLSVSDSERQLDYLKQQSLNDAIVDAYALDLAGKRNISVSGDQLDEFMKDKRQIDGTEITVRAQDAVNRDFYDWSPEDYRHIIHTKLVRREVAYAVDEQAKQTAEYLEELVAKASPKTSWQELVTKNEDSLAGVTYGVSGMVPKTNQDGGLAAKALELKKGEVSGLFRSSADGKDYYALVRQIGQDKTKVNYEFLLVPLTVFQNKVDKLYQEGKVKAYINVPLEGDDAHDDKQD